MKLLLMLVVLSSLVSCGFEVVDDGYVGVKKSMGKVEMEEYLPGVHFYNPLTTSIFEMEIREKSEKGKVSAYSADNQIIQTSFKVNYKPIAKFMAELFVGQGNDYINIILRQRTTASLKEILGQYKATDLVPSRSKATTQVFETLTKKLAGTHINLVGFEITNFNFDDDFERAVKNKVVAKEKAKEEMNRTVQIKEKNKQKVDTARADATAIRVKAAALAQNKSIIELEAVKKWDGRLPQYMMGGKTMPFIKLK